MSNSLDRSSAVYVVMHGRKQQKRDRNFSVPFGNIKNPREAYFAALQSLQGYDPVRNTLCGQAFIGEVNDWAELFKQHQEGPHRDTPLSPTSGIEQRDCRFCFYRYGNPDMDCFIAGKKTKKRFGIDPKEKMPAIIDGKNVGHFCPHYLNKNAE